MVDDLGIPELTTQQIELLCTATEDAARKHVLSRVGNKKIERLDVSVEVEGIKPVNVTVEVNLVLSPQAKGVDAETIVKEAVEEAQSTAEKYLRNLK
jgi:hypothetical protein